MKRKFIMAMFGLLVANFSMAQPQPTTVRKFLTVDEATLSAVKRWQQTGNAKPIVSDDGVVLYPFGQYQPKVVCSPLHVCDIALQPGEKVVSDPSAGDSVRWDISKAVSGVGDKKEIHVVVKPKDLDLETNLVVRTDKRVYHINLVSRNEGEYMSQIGFYYPSEVVGGWVESEEQVVAATKKKEGEDVAELSVDLSKVDADYEIKGGTAETRPVRAFNDGVRTFIQMPKNSSGWEAGALVLIGKGDEKMLTNYRVKGQWYIVDKVVTHVALLLGENGKDSRVDIQKKKTGWWN
ncbi:MAG: P-type conjugative transfer protein TrbG [Candidatus Paceibacterota bacterium]|jgi:type IV secretion system protein VirB9